MRDKIHAIVLSKLGKFGNTEILNRVTDDILEICKSDDREGISDEELLTVIELACVIFSINYENQ